MVWYCLDSPILFTWTSRLKETLLSAGSETEALGATGGSKCVPGGLQPSPPLSNSERCIVSILPFNLFSRSYHTTRAHRFLFCSPKPPLVLVLTLLSPHPRAFSPPIFPFPLFCSHKHTRRPDHRPVSQAKLCF